MGLSGALQHGVDVATGALLGLPGGSEAAVVTPPGGAPPVANVPVIVRYVNDVKRQGVAGAQRTGAIVRLRRADYPTRPVAGTTVVRNGRPEETLELKTITRDAAWWKAEAVRV